MNHTAFFAAVKSGALARCYLMEGTEEYIKQQALTRLCEKLLPAGLETMNLSELRNPDAERLIADCETLPFLSDKRVVIVRDCDLLEVGRKAEDGDKADALADYLPRLPESTCLVFTVRGKADARKKLYKKIKAAQGVVDFSPMSDAECADWAQRAMRAMGKQLEPEIAQKLVFTVGRDAALLRQEMEKLCAYLGERERVAAEDVDAVCVRSLECTVFQMVDAQVAGRTEEAFRLLKSMLQNGEDRFGILAMLVRQYRILYHVRRMSEEGVAQGQLAALAGIPPYFLSQTQAQARRYPLARLKAAYDYLFGLEYDLKSGRVSQESVAENALLMLDRLLRDDQPAIASF